jgi:hypothetical protein
VTQPSIPSSGISIIVPSVANCPEGCWSLRARQIVQPIASSISGTTICGWIESTHPSRRFMNTSRVYGGGRAASASDPATPHGETSHDASPNIIPNPVAMSDGPSSFNAGPRWKRLVSTRSPNTAINEKPKTMHVVGCVYAATIPSRNSATRAPQDVRPGSKNA